MAKGSDGDAEAEVVEAVEAVEGEEELPPIDFSTFMVSLSASAMMHMGQGRESGGAELEPNLPLAKQTIDLLALLEIKTRGNLTGDEKRLLSQLLFDLRTRYVAAADRT